MTMHPNMHGIVAQRIAKRLFKHRGPKLFTKRAGLSKRRRKTGLHMPPSTDYTGCITKAHMRSGSLRLRAVKRTTEASRRRTRVTQAMQAGWLASAVATHDRRQAWLNPKGGRIDRANLFNACSVIGEYVDGGISRHVIRLGGPYIQMLVRRDTEYYGPSAIGNKTKTVAPTVLMYQDRRVAYHH